MYLPSPPCCSLLSSFLFVPPCYCSSSWVLLSTGYSSWCSMAKDSSCLPFVSILVSLSVPNLSPYFSISTAILLSGCFRSKESPCLPFLISLSIAQCASFWWLWGQDSSPICFPTRLSTSLSHVAVLSGCFRCTVCSLSSVCLRACPPCSLQLVPLLLSLPLSLSLAVLLSRCLFAHMILSGSSLVLPCSLQRVSLIPSPLLLLLGEEWISWPLVFLPTFLPLCRSHSLTLGLPYLPPYLSPTCLLILSPLPCFSSIWDGEDSFSPLSFPSFLAPVVIVFPSAFFTSLLIPDVLAFGTQDSPCLPCVPICVLIQPVFSYMLFCVGSHQCPY